MTISDRYLERGRTCAKRAMDYRAHVERTIMDTIILGKTCNEGEVLLFVNSVNKEFDAVKKNLGRARRKQNAYQLFGDLCYYQAMLSCLAKNFREIERFCYGEKIILSPSFKSLISDLPSVVVNEQKLIGAQARKLYANSISLETILEKIIPRDEVLI